MKANIPVIDLFAGPGGLGEGFSSLQDDKGRSIFKNRLSVEKDYFAHKTLELRSFFRQFRAGEVPEEYYRYIRNEGVSREALFDRFKRQAREAQREAWHFELKEEHAEEIDKRIIDALNRRKTWVLIGGPPCQAYSVVGRVRMIGQNRKKYENDPRHYLYREYLRILEKHRPPVFVMENVPGLMSSKANGEGIFGKILNDLCLPRGAGKAKGYELFSLRRSSGKMRNSDFVVHAEKHGIPQRRHRLIIMGIRSDLRLEPEHIDNQDSYSTVLDAIQDLPKIRSGLSRESDTSAEWANIVKSFARSMIGSFSMPADLRREFMAVSTNMTTLPLGGEFVTSKNWVNPSNWLQKHDWWFKDKRLRGYCNHASRFHIREDICRYLFAACFAKVRESSPQISDFPEDLWPAHRNINDAVAKRLFSDRFRVQLAGSPATTVVSHISKDGH
jgi:DNA (cytosine-5)-methyltransferase 1